MNSFHKTAYKSLSTFFTKHYHRFSLMMLILCVIAVGISCTWYYLRYIHTQTITNHIESLEEEYATLTQELNNKKLYHQSYEQKLSEWNNRITSSPQPHEVIYQILDIATTSTITCIHVKQHGPIIHHYYTEIPATFHLHGSFEQVLLFFDHLETVTTSAIEDVSLRTADNLFTLDVMMKVHTTTLHSINVGNEFHHPSLKHSTL